MVMSGFFGFKGILILAAVMILFGGAVYDLTTSGVRCGIGVANPATNYTCEDLTASFGRTFVFPDENVNKGVNGVLVLDTLPNETLAEIGVMRSAQRSSFQTQILIGIVGTVVMVGILAFIFTKIAFSSGHELGAFFICLLAAIVVFSFMQVAGYSLGNAESEPGYLNVFGDATPFRGIRNLMKNPGVFAEAVDQTSILPGTLTTNDILT